MKDILNEINWELVIATIAIAISVMTMIFQMRHNKLSVKPIPLLVKGNYINVIRVRLWNKGAGPLIIKSLTAEKNGIRKNSIREFMPDLPHGIYYYEYILDFENRAIYPGESINLLEFRKNKKEHIDWYNKIKDILNGMVVTLKYESVYEDIKTITFKKLEFGFTNHEEISTHNEPTASNAGISVTQATT